MAHVQVLLVSYQPLAKPPPRATSSLAAELGPRLIGTLQGLLDLRCAAVRPVDARAARRRPAPDFLKKAQRACSLRAARDATASKACDCMDLIFHGPLGLELSLDRSTGVARVKAAEQDSPAQQALGRALTKIEGVPVGEIRDKKSWLAVVAKLQAPERPLSLTFEAPAVSPEEPVQPVQRRFPVFMA